MANPHEAKYIYRGHFQLHVPFWLLDQIEKHLSNIDSVRLGHPHSKFFDVPHYFDSLLPYHGNKTQPFLFPSSFRGCYTEE